MTLHCLHRKLPSLVFQAPILLTVGSGSSLQFLVGEKALWMAEAGSQAESKQAGGGKSTEGHQLSSLPSFTGDTHGTSMHTTIRHKDRPKC